MIYNILPYTITLQDNNAAPVWDQSFYLYVKDPESAALTFRAMDKDLFKEDDLLGLGAISVKELIVSIEFIRILKHLLIGDVVKVVNLLYDTPIDI